MSDCTCFVTPEKYWTTHYGAVEPGSMYEPNPDCQEHFGGMEIGALDLLGIAPDFTGGLSVDEYMDEQRGRGGE